MSPPNRKSDVTSIRSGKGRVAPPWLGGREAVAVFMVVVVLAVVAVFLVPFFQEHGSEPTMPVVGDQSPRAELEPMPYPVLAEADPLPDPEVVERQAEQLDFFDENPEALRLYDLDATTIAWVRRQVERDEANPPLPQRMPTERLVRNRPPAGTPILTVGRVIEDLPAPFGEETWRRLLIELEDQQYLQGVIPADTVEGVDEGVRCFISGRYLGTSELPTEGGGTQLVPTMLVNAVDARKNATIVDLFKSTDDDAFKRYSRNLDTYFATVEIDDDEAILEHNVYYNLLWQVHLDSTTPGAYGDPQDANAMAADLHHHPDDYRGQIFTVQGRVYDAWEDFAVAMDRPHAVDRVFRVWIGRWEPSDRKNHVYELALIADEDDELPETGRLVRATGRFFKVHGYEVAPSFLRSLTQGDIGVTPKSNKAYFKMIVGHDYEYLPEPAEIDWTWVQIAFLVVAASLTICMAIMINREHRRDDFTHKPVRRIRERRRELKKKGLLPGQRKEAAGDGGDAGPDEAAATEDVDAGPDGADATGHGADDEIPKRTSDDLADRD